MNHGNNDNGRVVDRFKQHDDGPGGYNSATFGQVGAGKTRQISTELMRRFMDDAENIRFVDSKDGAETGANHKP